MNDSSDATFGEFLIQAIDLLDQSMIKLENCFGQLSEAQIWWSASGNTNSIANQALHMCGNLQQWSIDSLCNQPDERQRDREFASSGTHTADQLINLLRTTVKRSREAIDSTCRVIDGHRMTDKISIQGFDVTIGQALMHTTAHFVGHTHQIILLTRIQLGDDYQFAWLSDGDKNRLPI